MSAPIPKEIASAILNNFRIMGLPGDATAISAAKLVPAGAPGIDIAISARTVVSAKHPCPCLPHLRAKALKQPAALGRSDYAAASVWERQSRADLRAMSVLAALAHEFGHVLWYDRFAPPQRGSWPWNFDLQTFCQGKFFNASWRRNDVDPPPPWRQFGDVQNSHVSGDTSMIDIFVSLLRKQRPAGEFLFNIYRPGDPWASPFAAFSPDEDFIETFKFYVLTNATGTEAGGAAHALSSLPIAITGNYYHTANIPNDYAGTRKANLKIKTACIQNAFDPP